MRELDDRETDRPRERQRRRRRQRPSREHSDLDDAPSGYLDARSRAERKVKITGEAIRFGAITLLLFVFFPPAAIVLLIWWGIPLFKRYYRVFFEPGIRERLVENEVERHVQAGLSRERVALEGRHARSLEELSASIAHEIRNPITAAKSLVQQMEEDPTGAENVEYARVALEELLRVEKSVSHLLRFAREEDVSTEQVKMADVVDSALETFRDRVARGGIQLEHQIDSEGVLQGDPEQLRRVVINLVGNAIDALDESQTREPRIDVHMGENLAGSEVWLRVRDNGPGIDRDLLAKMFSPFYTSKVNGTGLGLAICKKLVDAHGGSIEVTSEPGDGAEFLVTFPKLSDPEEAVS